MSRLRALVTGAGGFLGGALAQRLVADELEVGSLSRGTYPKLESLGVQQYQAELGTGSTAIAEAVRGRDVVFHVAARTGSWGPWADYERANVSGAREIVDACVEQGVSVLVYTSTPSVVFDGRDIEGADESIPRAVEHHAHYTRSKAMGEALVLERARAAKLACVALRPHLIWGPGDTSLLPRIVERARAGRLMKIRSGRKDRQIAPTHIDDAVQAHLDAWRTLRLQGASGRASGRAYFVTSGERIDPWTMIDGLLVSQGERPLSRQVPRSAAMLIAAAMELLWSVGRLAGEPPLTRWVVRELTTSHWFDISAAERELGFRPRRGIEEGLDELARRRRVL